MIKLYGVAISQPCRAVLWLLEINSIPYELIRALPGSVETNAKARKDYLKNFNPTGKVPTMVDTETNIKLYESGAILIYIATKYNLNDWYPTMNITNNNTNNNVSLLKRKSLIDQYLHWYHENVRLITLSFVGHLVRPAIKKETWLSLSYSIANQRKIVFKTLKILNKHFDNTNNNNNNNNLYLVGNKASIADLLYYQEICQFKRHDKLYPYSKFELEYPNVDQWLTRMEKLSCHDEVHKVMDKFNGYLNKRMIEMQNVTQAIVSKL